MNGMSEREGVPKSILLATDLSARCDRALDRAVALSRHWQAKLVIVHVIENLRDGEGDPGVPSWRRPPDPVSHARWQLVADVGPIVEDAEIVIAEGDPAEAILKIADARGVDLVVTGVARDELLGRFFLGTTVDRLVRRSHVPVLVVRNRARHAYRQIALATDFSEASRNVLETAVRYFPDESLTIFHAYDPPMDGFAADPAAFRRRHGEAAAQECDKFLASVAGGAEIGTRARRLIEFGSPADLLRQAVRDLGIDLVVVGTQGRSALFEVLIGSVAKEILAEVPCDVLVVREPRAVVEAAGGQPSPDAGGSSTR